MESAEQPEETSSRNASYFAGNERYAENVGSIDLYRAISEAINKEIKGSERLLDIGNGGVFDYDVSLAQLVTGLDLFVETTGVALPPNVRMERGDALHLEQGDGSYDAVLYSLVLHHLTGRRSKDILANISQTLNEAQRVLQPGGRLVIVESCVPNSFYQLEKVAFPLVLALARTRAMGGHPATLQLPIRTLVQLVKARFGECQFRRIPVGRWILQFGVRWPVALTPARPWVITAQKSTR